MNSNYHEDKNLLQLSVTKDIESNLNPDSSIAQLTSVLVMFIIVYLFYLLGNQFYTIGVTGFGYKHFIKFLDDKNVMTIIIGMMVATNARDLTKSITNHLIIPILKPLLPFMELKYPVKVGPFDLMLGSLISSILIFMINLYLIYLMVIILVQTDIELKGQVMF